MMRLLTPDGAIFYNNKERTKQNILQENGDITSGFPLRQKIIWHRKTMYDFNRARFANAHEIIYVIAMPKFQLLPKHTGMGDVWSILPERNNSHPAPFPIEVPGRCIWATCEPDKHTVLDPFAGSGTTLVAAAQQGCRYIGIEKSPRYAEMARRRAKKAEQ